ncbi:MAG: glycosyltransferase, partial [Pseudomonadota bacterium]
MLDYFLSVVCVVRNQQDSLHKTISEMSDFLGKHLRDYELIIIDNASTDNSANILRDMTPETGIANLQIYVLATYTDIDTASWVGLENALGDFVCVFDPLSDNIHFLSTMFDRVAAGDDVVFARNSSTTSQGIFYTIGFRIFNRLYTMINGTNLAKDAPRFRLLSRKVVNFILQTTNSTAAYRHLPLKGGFAKSVLEYHFTPSKAKAKRISDNIDRAMRVLISSSISPLRLATLLSMVGASVNLIYSAVILALRLLYDDITPGWASLAIQQSVMFFLISFVLMILCEYFLYYMGANASSKIHIGQEFSSAKMTGLKRLNIEETKTQNSHASTKATKTG